MKGIWVLPVIVSILILGTLGIQEVFADIIYESATLGPTGIGSGASVSSEQYLGSRFSIDQQVEVTEIGGHLFTTTGNIFGAIVELSGPSAIPSSFPLSASEVVASTVFSAPGSSSDVSVPLSVTLLPGDYAIIFGSGQFGATGTGLMPRNDVDTPEGVGSYFFALSGSWRDGQLNNARFTVGSTIVEVSCGSGTTLNESTNECEADVTQSQLNAALADLAIAEAQRDAALDELINLFTNNSCDPLAGTILEVFDCITGLITDLADALETITELEAQVEELGQPGPPVANQGNGQGVPAQGKNKP